MKEIIHVASPPQKPLMIFDGDCKFCVRWIQRWQQFTADQVDYSPSQNTAVRSRYPELSQESFDQSVQLIETNGQVYSGAEAVFRSLACDRSKRWLLWMYQNIPGFALFTEWLYRKVAANRERIGKWSRTSDGAME